MTPDVFILEAEHIDQLGDVIRFAGVALDAATLSALSTRVSASVDAYRAMVAQPHLSDHRTALRSLLALTEARDPPIGMIRARLRVLPDAMMAALDKRARQLSPQLLRCEMRPGGVRVWAERASAAELVFFLRALIVEGGIFERGRLRPDGTRRGGKIAPIVLGGAPGLHDTELGRPAPIYNNGRPAQDALQYLLGLLAVDWLLTTRQAPVPGRSEGTAFGRFVYAVLNWLELGDQAEGALRRYWGAVREGMSESSVDIEIGTPLILFSY